MAKGGSVQAQKAAAASAEQSRIDSQNIQKLLREQITQSRRQLNIEPPPPAAAPGVTSLTDAVAEMRESRRNLQSRQGLQSTRIVSPTRTAFGGYI